MRARHVTYYTISDKKKSSLGGIERSTFREPNFEFSQEITICQLELREQQTLQRRWQDLNLRPRKELISSQSR